MAPELEIITIDTVERERFESIVEKFLPTETLLQTDGENIPIQDIINELASD
jgi:hypothetical protein